jgi:hypothetical protein
VRSCPTPAGAALPSNAKSKGASASMLRCGARGPAAGIIVRRPREAARYGSANRGVTATVVVQFEYAVL